MDRETLIIVHLFKVITIGTCLSAFIAVASPDTRWNPLVLRPRTTGALPAASASPQDPAQPSNISAPIPPAGPKPLIILILGAPGVGKGTQSAFLTKTFPELTHVSYGDLIRKLHKDKSSEMFCLKDRTPGSTTPLVPNTMAAREMWKYICDNGADTTAWLLDGFPRNKTHVKEWLKYAPKAACVLNLHCPKDTSIARMKDRGQTSGRIEDSDTKLANERLERYGNDDEPLLQALRDEGMQIKPIDASRPIEDVSSDLEKIVKNVLEEWKAEQ